MTNETEKDKLLTGERIVALGSILVAICSLIFGYLQHKETLKVKTERLIIEERLKKQAGDSDYELKFIELFLKAKNPTDYQLIVAIGCYVSRNELVATRKGRIGKQRFI